MECDITTLVQRIRGAGVPISEQNAALAEMSLPVLCADYKLANITIWGQIQGLRQDYIIARGVTDDIVQEPRSFFSFDWVNWAELPTVTGDLIAGLHRAGITAQSQVPFTGDPALKYAPFNEEEQEEEEEEEEEEDDNNEQDDFDEDGGKGRAAKRHPRPKYKKIKKQPVTELQRVAMQVQYISNATNVVPKQAYMPLAGGRIIINTSWPGMSVESTKQMTSYVTRADLVNALLENPTGDPFVLEQMPTLATRKDKVLWTGEWCPISHTFVVRNRMWPGFLFFALSGVRTWGRFYWGNGLMNTDLIWTL